MASERGWMEDWKWVASELFLLSLSSSKRNRSRIDGNRRRTKTERLGKKARSTIAFTERKASKWLIIGWEEKLRITIEIKGENRKEK